MTVARLVDRQAGEILALAGGQAVTVDRFLSEVAGIAERLPAAGAVINVCEDRYSFLVGFGAALARGLTTLLPPNPLDETIRQVGQWWPGSSLLTDQPRRLPGMPVLQFDPSAKSPPENVDIDGSLVAAIAFTSGTTGSSVPQPKSWRSLVDSTMTNLRYYYPAGAATSVVVSTVPPQHMYGFETTVLSCLRGAVVMHGSRPFFPADVAKALRDLPGAGVLVSTPVHLRALVASGLDFPRLARVLSATAPLDGTLAAAVEARFRCEVIEIYGCTEVGSMAWRRTTAGASWQFFSGFEARIRDGGTTVTAPHLHEPIRLPDALEIHADGTFSLAGRDSDIVKVGGKRSSLAEVTRLVLAVEGVDDAVVFRAPDGGEDTRLAALVVSRTTDPRAIRAALSRELDPVFVPRPIIMVPALPRSTTGKLRQAAVLGLFAEVRRARTPDG